MVILGMGIILAVFEMLENLPCGYIDHKFQITMKMK